MPKNFEIKNSTAEFLMFVMEGKENGVQVTYKDETIWCTQKAMATLFDVGVPAISKHLKNIFDTGELSEKSVISILETTASDGKSYKTSFYSFCWLPCEFRPRHSIPPMGNLHIATICHTWLCY